MSDVEEFSTALIHKELAESRGPVSSFDWVVFTDGSCWDTHEGGAFGSASWVWHAHTNTGRTHVLSATGGNTDRAELSAAVLGLNHIHEALVEFAKGSEAYRFGNRVLWITDRESLALQATINSKTGNTFYRRSMNLDQWAAYEFLKTKLDINPMFAPRNSVAGMRLVDDLSRRARLGLKLQFPELTEDKPGCRDLLLWGDMCCLSRDVVMSAVVELRYNNPDFKMSKRGYKFDEVTEDVLERLINTDGAFKLNEHTLRIFIGDLSENAWKLNITTAGKLVPAVPITK